MAAVLAPRPRVLLFVLLEVPRVPEEEGLKKFF
jgi:hypothetical protein